MTSSDPDFAELIVSNREPTRAEIAVLLRRYLLGDIDDETVDRLYAQFQALVADPERRGAEASAFRGNGRRYLGQAWKELLSPHENSASRVELALWLAIVTPGYPRPRPYCPPELAGNWQQTDSDAIWKLASDGGFSCTAPEIVREKVVRWCVHLVERRGDFHRDRLWLLGNGRHNISPRQLIIRECKPDQLVLLRAGGDRDFVYELKRIEAG
jgi:hypothetical protein